MNNVSPLNLSDNLYSRLITDRDREGLANVLDVSGNYSYMSVLIDSINTEGSKQINTDKKETEYLGNNYVINPIQQVTQEGDCLVIELKDPNYNNFRYEDTVVCADTSIQALVIETRPGKVTVKPGSETSMASLLLSFKKNAYMKVQGSIAQNRGSVGRSNLTQYPENDFNYTSILRETSTISRRDMIDTFVKYQGKMWYHAQQPWAQRQAMRRKENMIWYNRRQKYYNNGNEYDSFGGIDWAITEAPVGRGVHRPLTTLPSMATFERFMADTMDRNHGADKYRLMAMGRGMLSHIQNNYTLGFIQQVGMENTFGGAGVKGIDVRMYKVAGLEVNFVILPMLNDQEYFPEETTISAASYRLRQYDTYLLDFTPVPIVGGGTVPACQKYHRGPYEHYEAFIAGIDASPGSGITDDLIKAQSARKTWTATDLDASSYNYLTDFGIRFHGRNSGKMHLDVSVAA